MFVVFPPIYFRIRLISLAAQKFISDIANDALQHYKMKGTASGSSRNKTKVCVLDAVKVCSFWQLYSHSWAFTGFITFIL